MSQTILIESDQDMNKVFTLNLRTYTGTDVINRNSAQESIELLKILPSINLIICRNKINGENTALEINKFLHENKMDIPLIVLGEVVELKNEVLQLKEPVSWEMLIRQASILLGVTEEELREKVKPNYIPISISYFYDIDHTPCDVFIRIKKAPDDYQFVKRLFPQDSFTSTDIDKYKAQGLSEFYIPKDYQQYFVTFVTNSIINKLENELNLNVRLKTNANAYEIVKEHINKAGVTQEVTELAESNIESMIKSVKSAPKLANLLKFLFSSKLSYAYQKAHLICVIGNFIMSKQTWYEERHLITFTYLSFFADITLRSTRQMKVNSQDELIAAHFEQDEKNEVILHAKNASEIVKDFPKSTEYIEIVTLQHQGTLDGIGFPDEPSEDLHPIAKVFVIADSFVKTMLDPTAPKSKREILTVLYMQYTNPSYQKIIKVLEQKID